MVLLVALKSNQILYNDIDGITVFFEYLNFIHFDLIMLLNFI